MNKYFLVVEIEINHHCNLTCSYCPNAVQERKSKGMMNVDQFTHIMNQLKDINYQGRICYHFYNEPLLHPNLSDFLRISKEILPQSVSEIFSNGMFITKEKFHELKNAGVDKFSITKHEGLKRIVFEETYKQLTEEEKKCVKYQDYSSLIFTSRGGLVNYGKKITEPLKRICLIPSSTVVITVSGDVLTCYEDFEEKNVMGNIFKEHIKDIWAKEEYKKMREDLSKGRRELHDVCKTCNNYQAIQ